MNITNDDNILRISVESGDEVFSAGWRDTGTDRVKNNIT
jgi:hypothetical protein